MNDEKSAKTETPQNPHSAPKDVAANDLKSEQIAIAAYHKAASRGFAPGHEVDDWLAAEREVRSKPESNVPHMGNSVSTDEFQEGPKTVAGVKDLRNETPKVSGSAPKR